MHQLFSDMQERFETLYRAIEAAVADLPAEALDWKPAPDMNSVTVLLTHTAGALRYWVGDVAGGRPSGRVRAAEFETRDVDAAELMGRLRAAVDFAVRCWERSTRPDWARFASPASRTRSALSAGRCSTPWSTRASTLAISR